MVVDWLYQRKSWNTCRAAREFLGQIGATAAVVVDGKAVRYGPAEVLGLLGGVTTVVATKGKAVTVFDLAGDRPENDVLIGHLIGPTGNLRAPTIRVGPALVVGFNPEAYRLVFGGSK